MYAQFRYLDGPRAGESKAVGGDFATIGRHPESDIAFDPEKELQVSIRHAAVFKQGGGFLVRDLGSTNGTFLNGKRVRGDRPLEMGDLLQFGSSGPKVEFSIVTTPPHQSRLDASPAPTRVKAEIFAPRQRTTERIRAEVKKQTRPWKWIAAGAVVLAVVAGSGAAWRARRIEREMEQQRIGLLARVDDLLNRIEQSNRPAAGIATALAESRREIVSLRATIASERLSSEKLDTLAQALVGQADRQSMVLTAAGFDPVAAVKASSQAVVVVLAELADGRASSGSGFAVRTAGDSIWIVTAKHVVVDSAGVPAARLAVIFNGTGQAFRTGLVRAHDSADVAVLVTTIRGGAPVVGSLGDPPAAGSPVAMLGFPFGLDSLGDWRRRGAHATTSVGTMTDVGPELFALDGYGTYGSSGSPIFSATGAVLGFISGRSTNGSGKLIGVPSERIAQMMGRRADERTSRRTGRP